MSDVLSLGRAPAEDNLVETISSARAIEQSASRFDVDLSCLRLAAERGSVSAVKFLLSDTSFREWANQQPATRAFLVQVDHWLSGAQAFESVNGIGSALVYDHPVNVKSREAGRVVAERRAAASRLRNEIA